MEVDPTPASNEFLIRSAAPADAVAVAELSAELGYPSDATAVSGRLGTLLISARDVVLVGVRDGCVMGWIHASDQALLESGRRCEILGLVVATAARRGGLGRALVGAVERWAADRGLSEITVRSNITRRESHPFYEGLHFTRVKTQHVYRKRVPSAEVT